MLEEPLVFVDLLFEMRSVILGGEFGRDLLRSEEVTLIKLHAQGCGELASSVHDN